MPAAKVQHRTAFGIFLKKANELRIGLAEEIRVRLLVRMINEVGLEGPAELGKAESLSLAMEHAMQRSGNGILLKQTLAGAVISLTRNRLKITPAPPRRAAARKRP